MTSPATEDDRKRAYRLRDIVTRGRRELKPAEARWLAEYNKAHPPRGPQKGKARPRGAPTAAADVAPDVPAELKPETISWIKRDRPEPAPSETEPTATLPLEMGTEPANENARPASNDNAATSPAVEPEAPTSLGLSPPPPAPEPSISNALIAAIVAGMFSTEVTALVSTVGLEVRGPDGKPVEWQGMLADGYRRALTSTLDRYFPAGAASPATDLYVSIGGAAVIVGGPMARKYVADQLAQKAPPKAPGAPERKEAPEPAPRQEDAPARPLGSEAPDEADVPVY